MITSYSLLIAPPSQTRAIGDVQADHPAGAEPAGRDVDEQTSRDDLGDGLDAELAHPGGRGDVVDASAVVRAIADLQVAERVEVRPELSRPRDDLGDPVHAV